MDILNKWLQRPPKDSLEQQCQDLTNLLREKEKALETTAYDLKVKTAAMYLLEQKIMSSETMYTSVQRELGSRNEQLKTLEAELALRSNRVNDLEAEVIAVRQTLNELNSAMASQANDLQMAQQACRAAEQGQEVLKEEVRVLREHIAQLNDGLADRELLRDNLKKLESVHDRVHRMETELSDKEAAHLGTIQQLEHSLSERDRQMEKVTTVTRLLHEKESEVTEWERKCMHAAQEHEGAVAKLQEEYKAQAQLREQHRINKQQLHERDELIANLNRQLDDLQASRQDLLQEVQRIPEKDEQIDRLQKRLKELRGSLREKTAPAQATVRHARQNGAGKNAHERPRKPGKNKQKDDLDKINGIGPVFAQALNQMGTHTFIQIARWKPEDIEKVAKKLDTDPERINRDNWIADAKEQHYQKYGERI